MNDIRNNKIKLKQFLMKYIKTDDKGKVLLSKDDDYRNETEWDKIYRDKYKI